MSKQPTALPSSWLVQRRLTEAARFLAEQDITDAEDIQITLESEQPDAVDLADRYIADRQMCQYLVSALKARMLAIQARIKRLEARDEKDFEVLLSMLEVLGVPQLITPSGTASRRRQQGRVLITDEAMLPKAFKRTVPESEQPDKIAIAKALRDGQAVPGAVLGNAYNTLTINV